MIDPEPTANVDLWRQAPFTIGSASVRPSTREVAIGDRLEVLEPRVMQVLVVLARRRGEVVSRDELIAACWGGRSVVDAAIRRCIVAIRRLAEARGGFSVTTVVRVGYRLDEAPSAPEDIPARALARRAPLVGREKELETLRRMLSEAVAGQGGMALLSGEPGIGKTRLAQEIGAEAAQRGALVLTGHCYEAGGEVPYGPFAELMEQTARKAPANVLRGALGQDAAEVAKIFPEVRKFFSDIPPPEKVAPHQEQRYLHNGFQAYLERLAQNRLLVLVIEDLHWADEASTGLLHHIVQRISDLPILVLGTHRDGERDMGKPFADFLEHSVRQRHAERVPLRGLSETDTARLIRALTGKEFPREQLVGANIPPAWVSRLHQASVGNPFFIEEVVRHLAEEGRLFRADGRLRSDIKTVELGVPDSVQLVIGRRLSRLSATARAVLSAAAVAGHRFELELLGALGLAAADAVHAAMGEAAMAGLVEADDGGYRFSHDLIRQAILAGTPPDRARRLHLQIAETLERMGGSPSEAGQARIERHFAEAALLLEPTERVRRLTRAGESALKTAAFEEALGRFNPALDFLPAAPSRARAALLYGRAQSYHGLGRDREAIEDLREALGAYEQAGDRGGAVKACVILCDLLYHGRRVREAIDICKRGLAALDDQRCGDRVLLLGALGTYLCQLRDYETGEAMLDQAETLGLEVDDQGALARLYDRRAWLHMELGEMPQGVALSTQAVSAARASNDEQCLGGSLTKLAGSLLGMGRWDEVKAVLDESDAVALRNGDRIAWNANQQTRGALFGGQRNRHNVDRNREYLRTLSEHPVHRSDALAGIGAADYFLGRWEDAAQCFEDGLRSGARAPGGPVCWGALLVISARLGDRARAEAMLGERRSDLESGPAIERRLATSWWRLLAMAEALVVLGRHEEAARFYPALRAHLDQCVLGGFEFRLNECTVGMTAAAGGDWAVAEQHFKNTLDLAERLPHLVEQAHTRQAWAEALLRRGRQEDRERALTLFREAADRYEALGMARHLEIARSSIAVA